MSTNFVRNAIYHIRYNPLVWASADSSLPEVPSRGSNGGSVSFRVNPRPICSRLASSARSCSRFHAFRGEVRDNPPPRKKLFLVDVDSPVPDDNWKVAPDGNIAAALRSSIVSIPGLSNGVACPAKSSPRIGGDAPKQAKSQ